MKKDFESQLTVTIGVVALNEQKALPLLLDCIKQQTYPHDKIEVILIDGLSKDSTKQIMLNFASNNDFRDVRCFDNPGIIQSTGWNIVIDNAKNDVIIRLDAHAKIPENFVERNVYYISQGEYVCGGPRPNIIDEETAWKNMLLTAESSMFGSSIAGYRRNIGDKIVNSVFHGAYRKEVFERAGKFDERLVRTEDNDIHQRIRVAGYDIHFHSDIISWQQTRSSLKAMLRQKYLNGYWIGRTIWINPRCFSAYHFVPMLFVLAIVFASILALFGITIFAKLLWGIYAAVTILMTIVAIVSNRNFNPYYLLLPFIFLAMHISYGTGTIVGMLYGIKIVFSKK